MSNENKSVAEDALRKDDLVGRQSITLRACGTLGFNEDGYFIIIDATDEGMKKAIEIIKDLASKYKQKDKALSEFDKQESTAIEGFGNIMGDD